MRTRGATAGPPLISVRAELIHLPLASWKNIDSKALGASGTLFACVEKSRYADKKQLLVVLSAVHGLKVPIALQVNRQPSTEVAMVGSSNLKGNTTPAGPSHDGAITLERHVVLSEPVFKVVRDIDRMAIDECSGRICLGTRGEDEIVIVDPLVM